MELLAPRSGEEADEDLVLSLMREAAWAHDVVASKGDWAATLLHRAGGEGIFLAAHREGGADLALATLKAEVQGPSSVGPGILSGLLKYTRGAGDRPLLLTRGLAYLAEFASRLAKAEVEDQVLHAAAHVSQDCLAADSVYLFTSDREFLRGRASVTEEPGDGFGALRLPICAIAAMERALEPGGAEIVRGRELAQLAEFWPAVRHAESIYIGPLIGSSGCLGALVIVRGKRFLPAPGELQFLEAVGDLTSLGLEKTRISTWAAEEYCRAEAGKDEFESLLWTASHDLKTPIVALLGLVRALRTDYVDLSDSERLRFVERIDYNAGRMQRLIRDLLEYARAGEDQEDKRAIDVAALLEDLRVDLAEAIKTADGRLELGETLPSVLGDPARLREVFRNLIENALLYSKPAPLVRVSGAAEGDRAVFWLRDSGPGIAPSWHERVFKACAREPAARRLNPGGTGMGLAIVKRIVEWHGGDVAIESSSPQGTTFRMTLPLAPERLPAD